MTAPVFVCPQAGEAVAGQALVLTGAEGRHAVSVKRLRPGEEAVFTDGAGAGAVGAVASVAGKDQLTLTVREVRRETPPELSVTVVQALPKGDRGEVAVETMTETGVDTVVPWAAARCVTQWRGERAAKSLAKWRNTAQEAGKQARRLWFPEVTGLVTTRQLVALVADADLAVVLHEEGASPLASLPLPAAGRLVLVVGPEGGVAPEELTALTEAGARVAKLGPTVLRTSTAGTAALAAVFTRTRWSAAGVAAPPA